MWSRSQKKVWSEWNRFHRWQIHLFCKLPWETGYVVLSSRLRKMRTWVQLQLFPVCSIFLRTYICIFVFCLPFPQMAWLEFFPNSYAATQNRTHVSSVAPPWGTLIQDALPTELPRPRLSLLIVAFMRKLRTCKSKIALCQRTQRAMWPCLK